MEKRLNKNSTDSLESPDELRGRRQTMFQVNLMKQREDFGGSAFQKRKMSEAPLAYKKTLQRFSSIASPKKSRVGFGIDGKVDGKPYLVDIHSMLHNISAAGLNEENAKKAQRIKNILDGLRDASAARKDKDVESDKHNHVRAESTAVCARCQNKENKDEQSELKSGRSKRNQKQEDLIRSTPGAPKQPSTRYEKEESDQDDRELETSLSKKKLKILDSLESAIAEKMTKYQKNKEEEKKSISSGSERGKDELKSWSKSQMENKKQDLKSKLGKGIDKLIKNAKGAKKDDGKQKKKRPASSDSSSSPEWSRKEAKKRETPQDPEKNKPSKKKIQDEEISSSRLRRKEKKEKTQPQSSSGTRSRDSSKDKKQQKPSLANAKSKKNWSKVRAVGSAMIIKNQKEEIQENESSLKDKKKSKDKIKDQINEKLKSKVIDKTQDIKLLQDKLKQKMKDNLKTKISKSKNREKVKSQNGSDEELKVRDESKQKKKKSASSDSEKAAAPAKKEKSKVKEIKRTQSPADEESVKPKKKSKNKDEASKDKSDEISVLEAKKTDKVKNKQENSLSNEKDDKGKRDKSKKSKILDLVGDSIQKGIKKKLALKLKDEKEDSDNLDQNIKTKKKKEKKKTIDEDDKQEIMNDETQKKKKKSEVVEENGSKSKPKKGKILDLIGESLSKSITKKKIKQKDEEESEKVGKDDPKLKKKKKDIEEEQIPGQDDSKPKKKKKDLEEETPGQDDPKPKKKKKDLEEEETPGKDDSKPKKKKKDIEETPGNEEAKPKKKKTDTGETPSKPKAKKNKILDSIGDSIKNSVSIKKSARKRELAMQELAKEIETPQVDKNKIEEEAESNEDDKKENKNKKNNKKDEKTVDKTEDTKDELFDKQSKINQRNKSPNQIVENQIHDQEVEKIIDKKSKTQVEKQFDQLGGDEQKQHLIENLIANKEYKLAKQLGAHINQIMEESDVRDKSMLRLQLMKSLLLSQGQSFVGDDFEPGQPNIDMSLTATMKTMKTMFDKQVPLSKSKEDLLQLGSKSSRSATPTNKQQKINASQIIEEAQNLGLNQSLNQTLFIKGGQTNQIRITDNNADLQVLPGDSFDLNNMTFAAGIAANIETEVIHQINFTDSDKDINENQENIISPSRGGEQNFEDEQNNQNSSQIIRQNTHSNNNSPLNNHVDQIHPPSSISNPNFENDINKLKELYEKQQQQIEELKKSPMQYSLPQYNISSMQQNDVIPEEEEMISEIRPKSDIFANSQQKEGSGRTSTKMSQRKQDDSINQQIMTDFKSNFDKQKQVSQSQQQKGVFQNQTQNQVKEEQQQNPQSINNRSFHIQKKEYEDKFNTSPIEQINSQSKRNLPNSITNTQSQASIKQQERHHDQQILEKDLKKGRESRNSKLSDNLNNRQSNQDFRQSRKSNQLSHSRQIMINTQNSLSKSKGSSNGDGFQQSPKISQGSKGKNKQIDNISKYSSDKRLIIDKQPSNESIRSNFTIKSQKRQQELKVPNLNRFESRAGLQKKLSASPSPKPKDRDGRVSQLVRIRDNLGVVSKNNQSVEFNNHSQQKTSIQSSLKKNEQQSKQMSKVNLINSSGQNSIQKLINSIPQQSSAFDSTMGQNQEQQLLPNNFQSRTIQENPSKQKIQLSNQNLSRESSKNSMYQVFENSKLQIDKKRQSLADNRSSQKNSVIHNSPIRGSKHGSPIQGLDTKRISKLSSLEQNMSPKRTSQLSNIQKNNMLKQHQMIEGIDQSLERAPLELNRMSMSIDSQARRTNSQEEERQEHHITYDQMKQDSILHQDQADRESNQIYNKDLAEIPSYQTVQTTKNQQLNKNKFSSNISKIKEKYNFDRNTLRQGIGAYKKSSQNSSKINQNEFGVKKKSNSHNSKPFGKKPFAQHPNYPKPHALKAFVDEEAQSYKVLGKKRVSQASLMNQSAQSKTRYASQTLGEQMKLKKSPLLERQKKKVQSKQKLQVAPPQKQESNFARDMKRKQLDIRELMSKDIYLMENRTQIAAPVILDRTDQQIIQKKQFIKIEQINETPNSESSNIGAPAPEAETFDLQNPQHREYKKTFLEKQTLSVINEDQKSASGVDCSNSLEDRGKSVRVSQTHKSGRGDSRTMKKAAPTDDPNSPAFVGRQGEKNLVLGENQINRSIQSFDKLVSDMEGYLQNVRENGFVVGEQLSFDQEGRSSEEEGAERGDIEMMRASKDTGNNSRRKGRATAKSLASPSAKLPKSITLSKSKGSQLLDGSRSRSPAQEEVADLSEGNYQANERKNKNPQPPNKQKAKTYKSSAQNKQQEIGIYKQDHRGARVKNDDKQAAIKIQNFKAERADKRNSPFQHNEVSAFRPAGLTPIHERQARESNSSQQTELPPDIAALIIQSFIRMKQQQIRYQWVYRAVLIIQQSVLRWLATRDSRVATKQKNKQHVKRNHQHKSSVKESINLGLAAAGPMWQEKKWDSMYGREGQSTSLIPKDFGVSTVADVTSQATAQQKHQFDNQMSTQHKSKKYRARNQTTLIEPALDLAALTSSNEGTEYTQDGQVINIQLMLGAGKKGNKLQLGNVVHHSGKKQDSNKNSRNIQVKVQLEGGSNRKLQYPMPPLVAQIRNGTMTSEMQKEAYHSRNDDHAKTFDMAVAQPQGPKDAWIDQGNSPGSQQLAVNRQVQTPEGNNTKNQLERQQFNQYIEGPIETVGKTGLKLPALHVGNNPKENPSASPNQNQSNSRGQVVRNNEHHSPSIPYVENIQQAAATASFPNKSNLFYGNSNAPGSERMAHQSTAHNQGYRQQSQSISEANESESEQHEKQENLRSDQKEEKHQTAVQQSPSPQRRQVTPKRRHQHPFPMPQGTLTQQSLNKANMYLSQLRSSLHHQDQSKTVSPQQLKGPGRLAKEGSKPDLSVRSHHTRISTEQRRKLTQQKLTDKLFKKMNNVREFQTARGRESFNFSTVSNADVVQGRNTNNSNLKTHKTNKDQPHTLGGSPSYAPLATTQERFINTKHFKGMAIRTLHDDLYLPSIPLARNYQAQVKNFSQTGFQ